MATSNGSSGDDVIVGTSGTDYLNGGAGEDTLSGGAGSDFLNGGAGSDLLDGGSGSDTLNGGSGNDTLVYRLGENANGHDVYTGGSGTDTVRIMLTSAEWTDDAVQAELARYYSHLAAVQTNSHGEVSNGSSRDFTLTFGTSTLTVQMMERLEIYVDGVPVDLDAPTVDLPDSTVAGAVTEDGNDDGDSGTSETTSGSIKFFDLDVSDTHTVSVTPPASALGTLNASVTNIATGDGQGAVSWTYVLDDAAAQSLAAGETRTEVFAVTITDDEGKSVTQNVTISVTGTNDAPVITAAVDSGEVTEDALPTTAAGTIDFNDVDLADVHTVSAVPAASGYLGTFSVSVSEESTGDGAGTVAWSFAVDNAALQHLAAGETLTQTYTVTVNDGLADSNTQDVTVTITGTNDAAVITGTTTGTVTEATSSDPGVPTASGDLLATDVDGTDDTFQAVGTAAASDNGYGTFTLSATGEWVYTLDSSNTDVKALGSGDTLSDSFTVHSEDGTSQLISVTINGAADDRTAPTDIRLIANAAVVMQNNFSFSFSSMLAATDADPGAFTFTFAAGGTSFVSGSNTFNISGSALTSGISLGNNADHTLVIRATQTGDPDGVFYDETIRIITGSGGSTNDTVPGGGAMGTDDALFGGNGLDILIGGDGDDTLFGQDDNDQLFGGAGNDSLYGGNDNDILDGGTGNDSLVGGANIDTASYANALGDVAVDLGAGAATGADGNDTLSEIENVTGSDFNDILVGNSSANTLVGGAGADSLNGGNGQDLLTGGSGADTFVFNSANGDRVTDFLSADDVLDFQQSLFPLANGWTGGGGIDAVVSVAANGAVGTSIAGADLIIWNAGTVGSKDSAVEINAMLDSQNGTFDGGVFVLAHSSAVAGSPVALYYDADANDTGAGAGATLVAIFTNHTSLASLGLPTLTTDYMSH